MYQRLEQSSVSAILIFAAVPPSTKCHDLLTYLIEIIMLMFFVLFCTPCVRVRYTDIIIGSVS